MGETTYFSYTSNPQTSIQTSLAIVKGQQGPLWPGRLRDTWGADIRKHAQSIRSVFRALLFSLILTNESTQGFSYNRSVDLIIVRFWSSLDTRFTFPIIRWIFHMVPLIH